MQRVVTAEMDLELGAPVDLIFQIAAAQAMPVSREQLTFTQGDRVYTPTEIVDQSGSRLHRFTGEPGPLIVRYEATVDGAAATGRTSDLEAITYLRPSRYCQSDEVFGQARRQFKGLSGHELIAARDVTSANDPKLIEKLTLEDEESSVGTLLIGRRSDGNRYNRQELEAIREIIPSLAEALRVARGRFSRESAMQQRMEEMAARLAQLEGQASGKRPGSPRKARPNPGGLRVIPGGRTDDDDDKGPDGRWLN